MVTGIFITTMHLPILQLSCRRFGKTSHHLGLSAPYSPDLTPCDFWLFSKVKLPLKGRRFQTANEMKENVTRQLMAIPKKDFSDCFEKWKECWDKCVRPQGEYFEGV